MALQRKTQTRWRLMAQEESDEPRDIFAVLDGARVRKLPGFLEAHEAEYECLLAGDLDAVTLTRAPFLVRLRHDSIIAEWVLGEGWGQSWGICALTPSGAELDTVLRDLREALHTRLPDGRVVYFRFFDPRIWRPFFPTCDGTQLRTFFGRAVTAFACEDETGKSLLLDTMQKGAPRRRVIDLQA
jgi:hypothetical protein